MSTGVDLSIVITSYNTRELVLDCLASLEHCLGSPRHGRGSGPALATEVIVVDNASIDGTVEAVRRRFPRVHVIALPRNVGFAAGCNQGLLKRRGRIGLGLSLNLTRCECRRAIRVRRPLLSVRVSDARYRFWARRQDDFEGLLLLGSKGEGPVWTRA